VDGRNHALPREARLTGKAAFDRVFAGRLKRNTRYFRFFVGDPVAGKDVARLGMAVSRRVDKRSVVRNRLRRQIRESFRLALHELPALDIVVSARPEAAKSTRESAWQDLHEGWARLKSVVGNLPQTPSPVQGSA